MVASIWPDSQTHYTDRPNAILAAIERLDFGDVLLIEDQIWAYGYYPPNLGGYGLDWYRNLPVEFDDALFKMIRTATARGITVVEAAGNGEIDLDVFEPHNSTLWDTEDSGAIIVAAARVPAAGSNAAYTRFPESNYGSRTDCYAWGKYIPTAGDGTYGTGRRDYVPDFGGTSGAAAIIAGAALAMQGIAQANNFAPANTNSRLSPNQLRRILRDPTTGTASNDPHNDKIGVMPDLRAIITSLQARGGID
jgi:microbial collagenase